MSTFRYTKAKKLELLRAARALLDRPRGWTKGSFENYAHKDAKGYPAYCAIGAVRAAANDLGVPRVYDAVQRVSLVDFVNKTKGKTIVEFNDAKSTTKADVLAVFDGKIAELESA